jgi:hypothetical protein
MNIHYLEIDSTYRNRTQWINPGEFDVLISQTGRRDRNTAVDPVSLAAPITVWQSNRFDANTSGISLAVTVSAIAAPALIAGTNSTQTFIAEGVVGDLQQIENYYVGAVANNTTITEERRITAYKYMGVASGGINERGQFTVETAFGDTFADANAITIADPTDVSNTSFPVFFVPAGRDGHNAYTGLLLYNENLNQYRTVNGYDDVTHLLEVITTGAASTSGGPVTGWLITHNYCIRSEVPIFTGTALAGSTTTAVVFSATASSVNDFYNRQFLRITSGTEDNEIRMITDYVGATQTATVTPGFSAAPIAADTLEVLAFSFDNLSPFTYSTNNVHEEVCYEIELINLVLPTKTLNVAQGNSIIYYPYVYVELANLFSSSAGMSNTIYSNNPNSKRMLFRVAIDNIADPTLFSFVKLGGDKMKQTVKFKPNDNLHFSVHLPDGSIFTTVDTDPASPFSLDSKNQISALFSIRRLV